MTARPKGSVLQPDAVVFVDFDGVINDDEWLRRTVHELNPARVQHLDAICRRACASVVVVSAWRCFMPLDDLRAVLRRAGLTAPVLDAVGCDRGPDCGRAKHAALWLDAHPEVRRWVVIDDEYPWKGQKWRSRVVVTNGAEGLTFVDAATALSILEGQ